VCTLRTLPYTAVHRDSIVEKRKLLRTIGLYMEFPKISVIGIGFKLVLSCLQCRCLTVGAKKDSVDPRANIPLVMPTTAPPVPRSQYLRCSLQIMGIIARAHPRRYRQGIQRELEQMPLFVSVGIVSGVDVAKYGDVRVSQVKSSNCFRLHPTSMISKQSTISVPDSL